MTKITFLGAGSTVFAKNILGDCMLTPSLQNAHLALYDIDAARLAESKKMLETLNTSVNDGRARISAHLGVEERRAALEGASYVVNAIQVGGYEPCTVLDFEIPKKYGLRQTIGDTIGVGGIFRGLRTAHVMLDIARDMESVCPEAWLLNYTNPMSIVTGVMLHATGVKTVGLCHSVQVCAGLLLYHLDMHTQIKRLQWKVAGINHMGWLLEITDEGRDLYPEIKRRAAEKNREARRRGAEKHHDMVRYEMMRHFGYYLTESSEHAAEYYPYWIKSRFPELIDEFNIPLDEYPRRCERQIEEWKEQAQQLVYAKELDHSRTGEYGSYIMEAMETDTPYKLGGNVLNGGLISNLPSRAIVEVACLVDRNGVQGCHVGDLPEQCAALCRAHIGVHLLTIEAATELRREAIYQAAFLDPHTASELTLDETRSLCDELLEAEAAWLPEYR
jgi:alpha-galactosidase